jgi:putative transposase
VLSPSAFFVERELEGCHQEICPLTRPIHRTAFPPGSWQGVGQNLDMLVRLIAVIGRQLLRLVLLSSRSSRSKDIELLVLRQEVTVLRRQVNRPRIRPEERIVLSLLQWLRPARQRLSSLVTPDTLRRRHRELVRRKWTRPHRVNPRRRIPLETELLVWRLAKENPLWGYRRIQGELKKLGIEISASSIRRITCPKRRPGPKRDTWCQFMRNQAASIIACDLFTVETIRLKTLHVRFFIDLRTRKVLIGGVTDGATNLSWCTQIARNLSEARESRDIPVQFLVRDRDNRFGPTSTRYSRQRESGSCAHLGERLGPMPMPSDSFGLSEMNVSTGSSF